MTDDAIIEARELSMRFGGVLAVDGYSLTLGRHDLTGLIGPNGAGKTTAFNLLTGVLRPTSGSISVNGTDMTRQRPHRLAQAGLARTFQNIRLFADLSVLENVMCGGHVRHGSSLFSTLAWSPSFRRNERIIAAEATRIIGEVGLSAAIDRRAGDLSYGDQRRVEIARALATGPRALLLDEPAAGLNPSETQALVDLIRRINGEFGIGVLVVEHDMRLVMDLCRRIQVINRGKLVCEGTPAEVQADPAVIEAYLGTRRQGKAHA